MLLDLLRNYTCGRVEDGGSPPVRRTSWTYDERETMELSDGISCPAGGLYSDDGDDSDDDDEEEEEDSDDDDEEEEGVDRWTVHRGYLPAGDDIGTAEGMGVEDAKERCASVRACGGFTYRIDDGDGAEAPTVFFKGRSTATARRVQREDTWRSYVLPKARAVPARCADASPSDGDFDYAPPAEYAVEIMREEPLVTVVPNFASDSECALLMEAGGSDDEMSRAQEFGQGATEYRRSYSDNINVDYEDRSHPVTRFAERMFAFVRDQTGYDVHGPGQEPINAVLYKEVGDEYRPHCDGSCHGGRYRLGERVATTILYCDVPDGGSGQTSFTRSGLMVKPRRGDLLLFAYKYRNGTMDTGFTEHSGCPIRGGRKWIATQWYREGVNYDQDWESYAYGK